MHLLAPMYQDEKPDRLFCSDGFRDGVLPVAENGRHRCRPLRKDNIHKPKMNLQNTRGSEHMCFNGTDDFRRDLCVSGALASRERPGRIVVATGMIFGSIEATCAAIATICCSIVTAIGVGSQ